MARPNLELASVEEVLGYAQAVQNGLVEGESLAAFAAACRAHAPLLAALSARREALLAVETRCVASRVHRAFIDGVLAA